MITSNTSTEKPQRIACVTGASGMVGSRIVESLKDLGFFIRVLTRSHIDLPNVQIFRGSLSEEAVLDEFISGAEIIFHCAAELKDSSRMFETNVVGTVRLIALARKHNIRYFCHISSVGVIGTTTQALADENTICYPQNMYEKSKHEAELMFAAGIEGCKVVILRPTNVVDKSHLADLSLALDGSIRSKLMVFIKGGECAHLVHAEDVASAALFFIDQQVPTNPRIYIVSIDADPKNTVSYLWSIYSRISEGKTETKKNSFWHLPLWVPHLMRHLIGRGANRGDILYSSNRITSEGFKFKFGVEEIVKDIASKEH
jgi:nucleoside-diphosphate-sugar epimerase